MDRLSSRTLTAICSIIMLISGIATSNARSSDNSEKQYSFEVGQFTALKVVDNVNVIYHCQPDTTGVIHYTSDPDFADAFIFTNSGGTLKIQVTTEDVGKPGLPTIHVYSDFLSKIENDSEFQLKVNNLAPCPELSVLLIGNGNISIQGIRSTKVTARATAGNGQISLSGACNEAEFRITGTGTIQADNLAADKVTCKILGGGTIGCYPLDYLKVGGVGSTKIFYKGNPEIKHKGGGKLIKLSE